MAPQVQGRPSLPELWPIILTAPSSGCLDQSWSRNLSERVRAFSFLYTGIELIPMFLITGFGWSLPGFPQVPVWCENSLSWRESMLRPSSSWMRSTPSAHLGWREAQAGTVRCRGRCWSCSISWMASRQPRTSRYCRGSLCSLISLLWTLRCSVMCTGQPLNTCVTDDISACCIGSLCINDILWYNWYLFIYQHHLKLLMTTEDLYNILKQVMLHLLNKCSWVPNMGVKVLNNPNYSNILNSMSSISAGHHGH